MVEQMQKVCFEDEELEKLEKSSNEFSFQLCKEILQIVGKTAMMMGKAKKLFESELKNTLEQKQIPENKEYLKEMMDLLVQYQENERRMKDVRATFDEKVPDQVLQKRVERQHLKQSTEECKSSVEPITEITAEDMKKMQEQGKIKALGDLATNYRKPITEMQENIEAFEKTHQKILKKYVALEKAVADVSQNFGSAVQDAFVKACKEDDELDKLNSKHTDMIKLLQDQIQIVEVYGTLLQSQANDLFESDLKKEIVEVQLPDNKEYLKDMSDLLTQVQDQDGQRQLLQN